jgi:pimeloyl-ACP methyl ester carboxylesterase
MTTSVNMYTQSPLKSETISVNGSEIYYEVYGKGKPLFLLHGFTQSSKSWIPFVSDYADDFEVYLIDLKGHGRSSQFTGKISLKEVASEVNALAGYLKLDSINAIGFSYGGEVLFQLALMNPQLVKRMIIIGSCGSWNASEFPAWLDYLSYKNIDNLPWMREQQSSEEQIRSILAQVPNYVVSVSIDELKTIQTKTLLIIGDHDDSVPLECISAAKDNIPDSYLWILPNTDHRAHRDEHKEEFVRVSKEFFSGTW